MWYLKSELADWEEVENRLCQIWHWECLKLSSFLCAPERYEMAEALWAEYYS